MHHKLRFEFRYEIDHDTFENTQRDNSRWLLGLKSIKYVAWANYVLTQTVTQVSNTT
jgi:hypothetical protein